MQSFFHKKFIYFHLTKVKNLRVINAGNGCQVLSLHHVFLNVYNIIVNLNSCENKQVEYYEKN